MSVGSLWIGPCCIGNIPATAFEMVYEIATVAAVTTAPTAAGMVVPTVTFIIVSATATAWHRAQRKL